ncbi:MAG: geranylgeranylglyceryl/heptaprenylglyceryl phosphate synthase [Candidatus Methanofastidiosia archaeon]
MKVESYILEKLKEKKLHFTLIDPDSVSPKKARFIVETAESCGTDAIMIGGSINAVGGLIDGIAKAVKESTSLPVILFPGGIGSVTKHADAIFFMSFLNSRNPYFITKAQALGAYPVRLAGLEPLAMAYIVCEPGETVGWVGEADLIPREKPEIAASYALAAQFLGMKFVYLEAGSGSKSPLPPKFVSTVRRAIDIPLIVGGGLRRGKQVLEIARAGADIVVTGTVVEKAQDLSQKLEELISALK